MRSFAKTSPWTSERIRPMTPAELASADAASLCLVLFIRRSMLS